MNAKYHEICALYCALDIYVYIYKKETVSSNQSSNITVFRIREPPLKRHNMLVFQRKSSYAGYDVDIRVIQEDEARKIRRRPSTVRPWILSFQPLRLLFVLRCALLRQQPFLRLDVSFRTTIPKE